MKKLVSCLVVLVLLFAMALPGSLFAEEAVQSETNGNIESVNDSVINPLLGAEDSNANENDLESAPLKISQEDITGTAESPQTEGIGIPVNIPDQNLFNALKNNYIDSDNDGIITQAELKTRTVLNLENKNISNLTGLEYATELNILNLGSNINLVNISPIKDLKKLESLNLSGTNVTDADKISLLKLTDQTCTVGLSKVQFIKPSGLSDVYTVNSSDDSVVVVSIENSGIKLEGKKIGVATVTLFMGTAEKEFKVTVNGIPEGTIHFDDPHLFNELIHIGIDKNNDGCITQEEMKILTSLYLDNFGYGCQDITSLVGLEYATKLERITLTNHYQLTDLTPLSALTKLDYIQMNGTGVSNAGKASVLRLPNISGVQGYGQITTIYPRGLASNYTISSSDSDIVDASIIPSGEPQIKLLYKKEGSATITVSIAEGASKSFEVTVGALPENAVVFEDDNLAAALIRAGVDTNKDGSISKEELAMAERLALDNCGIANLKGLEGATSLKYLSLANNTELSDVEPIRGIAGNLSNLHLNNTKVSDHDRISLIQTEDLNIIEGVRIAWKAKPIGVLEIAGTQLTYSVPGMVESYGYYYDTFYITGKTPGTTLATIAYGDATKTFNITVNQINAEQPVGEKVTELPTLFGVDSTMIDKNGDLWDLSGGQSILIKSGVKQYQNMGEKTPNSTNDPDSLRRWGLVLDNADTLWLRDLTSANKTLVEQVKHVKESISEYVYLEANAGNRFDPISLALDNNNSLWIMNSESQPQAHTKILDNVRTFSWIFALDADNTLWQVYDSKKELFTDVEDFDYDTGNHRLSGAKIFALKSDHTLWGKSLNSESFVKITDNVQYLVKSKTGIGGYVKTDNTYWQYEQTQDFEDVQKENGPFVVKNDGSSWYRVNNNNYVKAIDGEIKDYRSSRGDGGFVYYIVDTNNVLWKFYSNGGTLATRIGENFSSFTELKLSYGGYELSGYIDNNGNWLDMTGKAQTDNNTILYFGNFSLRGNKIVYYNGIPLLDQVLTISDAGNDQAYATRIDGTIWSLSPNLPPAQIEIKNIMPGDVDASGKVQAFDALMALQIATGKKVGTDQEIKAADVGNSTKVEAYDALRILQFATGKITAF